MSSIKDSNDTYINVKYDDILNNSKDKKENC